MEVFEVCRMVARSLVAEIGPWGTQCVFIGGLVPGLLHPDIAADIAPHVGTRDVDLALLVAAIGDDAKMYRTLKSNLSSLGLYQTSNRSYEWKRYFDGFEIIVELFVPVGTPEQGGQIQSRPIEKSGSGLTALGIYGLELIKRDIELVEDEGMLLDGKGIKKVTLQICGPAVLIGLKAWALDQRTKSKDGYDVVWLMKAYGAKVLADRFVSKGLHETDFGIQAVGFLKEHFASPEHTGPIGWVDSSEFTGNERAREVREAVGIIRDFVDCISATQVSGESES